MSFQVDSDFGADGNGMTQIYEYDEVTFNEMKANYTAFLVHSADRDASICEVYFYLGSASVSDRF